LGTYIGEALLQIKNGSEASGINAPKPSLANCNQKELKVNKSINVRRVVGLYNIILLNV
jgi:hypothetical protein